ncbi:MAG: dephospho-CoA kinase [Planctomycetaceae bacterium]
MIVVGLVGRMAAGKSTVARMFAALGADVIDADAVAHEVLDEPAIRGAVANRFGPEVCGADGRVDRRRLAAIVFAAGPAAERALADLEALVHPRVRERMEAGLASHRRAEPAAGGPRVVVLDVPLLVQAGWADACDLIVVVECEESVRRARRADRGVEPAQQAARDRAWERGGDPRTAAPGKTVAVDASGDEAYTAVQVGRIWSALRR